ncbi:MAG: regulatory protein RecX [Anaerolineae bacterium]|nr:regulatory protein RecX [Anaerolineae bacterium]
MERKITALRVQKRNPHRVNVYLDGKFAFGVARVVAAWLQVGQMLNNGKIEELLKQESHETAYQRSLHFIATRPRTEKEVRQKLVGLGFSDDIIQSVISALKSKGYIDDVAFARTWIENRLAFHPRSYKLLKMELKRKGVPEEVIASTLEDTQINEDELALDLAKRYAPRLKGIDPHKFKTRLGAYLMRRGFPCTVSMPITEQIYRDYYQNNLRIREDRDNGF